MREGTGRILTRFSEDSFVGFSVFYVCSSLHSELLTELLIRDLSFIIVSEGLGTAWVQMLLCIAYTWGKGSL